MDLFSTIYSHIHAIEFPQIGPTDILEIIIIAFFLYQILVLVRNTRTWFLIKGIVVILLFFGVAVLLKMNTILFIAERSLSVIVIALIVVFQPELRKALEQLGKTNVIFNLFRNPDTPAADGFDVRTVDELVKACFSLGRTRTGALIVIEKELSLEEYVKTGIAVDAILTSPLLINIFEHNTPLHDGAVIVRGNRVVSATCYLPLSKNDSISKALGTRHRAAIGVSEVTDSLTIVVSEETGHVSVAENGKLSQRLPEHELRSRLEGLLKDPEEKSGGLWFFRGKAGAGK